MLRLRVRFVTTAFVVAASTGCGVTCEIGGSSRDFANCDVAFEDYRDSGLNNELTPNEENEFRVCLEDKCGFVFQTQP